MHARCSPDTLKSTPIPFPLRLYRMMYRIHSTEALNCDSVSAETDSSADLAANLKRAINRIKAEAIDPETGRVDYAGLAESDLFRDYQRVARALWAFDPFSLSDPDARKAFWINLYNALIVHAVIAYDVRESITEIGGVFDRAAYGVGGYRFSADDIEHGILRANAGHPLIPGPRFSAHDPRRDLALESLDPRIHFTLNCGAESCPPIGFYDSEHLDQQLDMAAVHFTSSGGVSVDRTAKTVQLSRIFTWYASDFNGKWFGSRNRAALLRGIAPYLANEADREFLHNYAAELGVTYTTYSWALNR